MARTKKFLSKTTKAHTFYKSVKSPRSAASGLRKTRTYAVEVEPPAVRRYAGKVETRPVRRSRPVEDFEYQDEELEHEEDLEPSEDYPDGKAAKDDVVEQLKEELAEHMEEQIKTALSAASARLDDLVKKFMVEQQPKRPIPRHQMAEARHAPMHKPVRKTRYAEHDEEEDDLDIPTFERNHNRAARRHVEHDDEEDARHSSRGKHEWENPASTKEHTQLLEKISFLEKELQAAHQRETKLQHDIEEVQKSFDTEKQQLSTELKQMKTTIEAAPTPQQNKLFSMSTELDQILAAMNKLVEEQPPEDGEEKGEQKTTEGTKEAGAKDGEAGNDAGDKAAEKKEAAGADKPDDKDKKKSKTKKLIIVVGAILIIVGGIAFAAMKFMGGETEVDPALLQEYLPEGAQPTEQTQQSSDAGQPKPEVQGASTQANAPPPQASGDKYAQSQADVSYTETRWETHRDPSFGVQFDYPINAANVVRTDTSITVIRKTGYIFKLQKIETALELDEYWTQIKARSLRYKVKETSFRELEAIFLELEDITDYPGDRYLVKNGEHVYDIWYATYSKSLADDDAKRVDVMLNSFKFINPDGSVLVPEKAAAKPAAVEVEDQEE